MRANEWTALLGDAARSSSVEGEIMKARTLYQKLHRSILSLVCIVISPLGLAQPALAIEKLKSYTVNADETSVSGISSGAYMAVQFGVAHASIIKGVGATAGGPYYCAFDEVPSLDGALDNVIARCMQGDPKYPKQEITPQHMNRMVETTDEWAQSGKIDEVVHLKRQKIWLFHGYNDGVIKFPVTDALYAYYAHYLGPNQIFYKNNLKAGHAQITTDCPAGKKVCNPCERTGGNFLNQCQDAAEREDPYDAAGSLLQHIYGTLQPKNTGAPTGKIIPFPQREFALDAAGAASPISTSMAEVGYAYVPDACEQQQPCRVHVVFHGCQQSATTVKDAFYGYAGYNEWADTNHLIVLYPQTQPTSFPPILPFNPQGCWDWWGYNDIFDSKGRYATKQGLQIAAVRRMLDRLAGSNPAKPPETAGGEFQAPSGFVVGDFTHRQVELRWETVGKSTGYNVYRATTSGGPYGEEQRVNSNPVTTTTFVDDKLNPGKEYFYVVRVVSPSGAESANSTEIGITTAKTPPPCDPYFSLDRNSPVTKNGAPTTQTCR
jgi:hypothetical protein